jgi:hypothetical protein
LREIKWSSRLFDKPGHAKRFRIPSIWDLGMRILSISDLGFFRFGIWECGLWIYGILSIYINELPRSRAARYQKEFSFNPDAEHRRILLIKKKETSEGYTHKSVTGMHRFNLCNPKSDIPNPKSKDPQPVTRNPQHVTRIAQRVPRNTELGTRFYIFLL